MTSHASGAEWWGVGCWEEGFVKRLAPLVERMMDQGPGATL